MDLAGQAAPGASQSLVGAVLAGRASFPGIRGAFLRAPAACWWARQEVESTLTIDQSIRPSASASARTAAKILSQVPSADQRLCRSYTVFHGPKRAGRSRHGTPVRSRYRIPLMTLRWLAQRPPRCPDFGKCGFSRAHSTCVKSPRPMPMPTTPSRDGHMISSCSVSQRLVGGRSACLEVGLPPAVWRADQHGEAVTWSGAQGDEGKVGQLYRHHFTGGPRRRPAQRRAVARSQAAGADLQRSSPTWKYITRSCRNPGLPAFPRTQ
jgi:hypothetical protein